MDIVHLIETQMNKSVQEQTSRTYAEIEKTLDHSEGSNTSKHSIQQPVRRLYLTSGSYMRICLHIDSSYVCVFFSVCSPIFSARGCRQPQSCEKSGVRPPTTSSCFWRGPLCCFPIGYSFLGRACWTHPLRKHARWPVGGARDPTVNYSFEIIPASATYISSVTWCHNIWRTSTDTHSTHQKRLIHIKK